MSQVVRTWAVRLGASLMLLACAQESLVAPTRTGSGAAAAEAVSAINTCSTCIFGPFLYVRAAGQPTTQVSTFAADTSARYVLSISSGGSRGANAIVLLNGKTVYDGNAVVDTLSLAATNTISVRLTGKPGSQLTVAIEQVVPPVARLKIVFATNDNNALRVYSMRGDGSNVQFMNEGTDPTEVGNLVLARGAFQDNAIYAMDSTGANRHEILGPGPSYVPDLSPDGSRFVLMFGDCGGGDHPVAIANADGSGLHVLNACTSTAPRWSPSGNRIAFSRGLTVYTANPDGSGVVAVTSLPGGDYTTLGGVVWSPDGTRLIFPWRAPGQSAFGVYMVNADGTNLHQVPGGPGGDSYPQDWSANGDWILAGSTASGTYQLWVMRSDGSSPSQLTSGPGDLETARWVR